MFTLGQSSMLELELVSKSDRNKTKASEVEDGQKSKLSC